MHSLNYPVRVAGVAIALGLIASACGAESPTTIEAAPAADQPAADDAADAPEPSEAAEPAADASADAPQDADEAEEAAPVTDHLFPDLDTVNIVDGSSINLAAELAGGDTPILLWFWAPH